MDRYIQVFTTIPDKQDGNKISKALIGKRLAACVQIGGPIKSVYRWKGKVETEREWVCIIKTRESLYEKVEKIIKAIHPYEIPEIIASPITRANRDYLKWLSKETIKPNG